VFTFCIRRILTAIPLGIGVVLIVALLIHAVPGDPVDSMLSGTATEDDRQAVRVALGLDKPVLEQMVRYLWGVLHGDLGNSLLLGKPVTTLILERLQPTIELAILALIVAITLSLPLGIISAVKKGTVIDYAAMALALVGVAVPTFWLGPLLILLFSLELELLPVSERIDMWSYVLPAVTLGTALAAALSRMTRNSVLENLREDYVRTARAKGQKEALVVGKHVLRNAALPLVTIVGLQFGVLLTGAIITERIFDWPGLGSLIIEGINSRDYPVVQGCVLFFSGTYLAVNLLTDLTYALVDPRIRIDK
jgi:peptide/nickel transport system permease protein